MQLTVIQRFAWLVKWLRNADALNLYIGASGIGMVWVMGTAYIFYRNPLTNNKTSLSGMISFDFINPWMKAHPVTAPKMKLSDLPKETISGGEGSKSEVQKISERFMDQWNRRRSSSSAIFRLMLPWWTFTHVLQAPRKFVQFLPPMLVQHLLGFLQVSGGHHPIKLPTLTPLPIKLATDPPLRPDTASPLRARRTPRCRSRSATSSCCSQRCR
jgi:hypothetical protein